MAKKKGFSELPNPALSFITTQGQVDEVNQEEPEEKIEITNTVKTEAKEVQVHKLTQGKKGGKLPRMNMAFVPENYEHIEVMSSMQGTNKTQYVNDLIAKDRKEKKELVDKYKEFRKGVL